ncbi:MAG: dihydroorotate dehydrogenase electron transfer subunit [Candidatus Accumulibacter sp.]|jgi:dihydroorotate dehydrogenase electron transfer subunit|nr:dihydroorotate dehydrogenase electron transfer subunit [Accumulibacter sp.]
MRFASKILSNTEVSPGYRRIRLTAPETFAARPGQFVMVRVGAGFDPLLRRPLAVFDVGAAEFEMLYKVIGKGTARLATLREGDDLDILGPLGKGVFHFDRDDGTEKLLVGGGIGLAPLHLLARALEGGRSPVRLFAGGRARGDLLCLDRFESLGVDCHCATEDGSFGTHGRVTEVLDRHLAAMEGRAALYACGPDGLLRALAGIAAARALPCQVSLEGRMACGVGACLGCVTAGRAHSVQTPDYRCLCTDGPVFESGELKWGDET